MIEQNGSYLGRYQAGDAVPLRLACVDRSTNGVTLPREAPWLRVYGVGGITVGFLPAMPVEDRHGLPGLFRHDLRLDISYEIGHYTVVYTYRVSNQTYCVRDQFEVMPGSDASGTVISLYSYHHPESNFVFAQLTSRRLVMGRNPKV